MRVLFPVIILALGVLIGERYGVPGLVTGITDKGFDIVDQYNPLVKAEDAEDAAE